MFINRYGLVIPGILLALAVAAPSTAGEPGWVPLFNGRNLDGWVNVNCALSTFTVKETMIYCTGVPTGLLRTERQYENFILELEWMHVKPQGNAGLFIWSDALPAPGVPFTRSVEVQIMDGIDTENYTSHGDMFSIHGATLRPDRPHPNGWPRSLPTEKRCRPAGQWNHYRLECNNGAIKLAVNGKVVSGVSQCNPRKGYVCLESEGSPVWFKNIRIKELPGTNPRPEEIAAVDEGFRSLYTGVDLSGWKQDPGHIGHWQPKDWILDYDGQSQAKDQNLWTERELGDFALICDWRLAARQVKRMVPLILPNGDQAVEENGKPKLVEIMDAGDSGIFLRGSSKSEVNIWCWPVGSGEVYGYRTGKGLPPEVRAAVTPKVKADNPPGQWNRFVITLRGDRLTVQLNGTTVIDNAPLPGIPPRGPIALQHYGSPIQFANIYIRDLKG